MVDYLYDLGVYVEFGGSINGYFFEEGVITISNKQSYKSKLYTLLHEAGHYLLRTKDDRFDSNMLSGRKTKKQRMNILHEEFLAWDEGLRLSEELNLVIDQAHWDSFAKKQLFDYVQWTSDPKVFSEEKVNCKK